MANHIQNQDIRIKALSNELDEALEQINLLKDYLYSAKFQGVDNAWVNPRDVLDRLPEIYPASEVLKRL